MKIIFRLITYFLLLSFISQCKTAAMTSDGMYNVKNYGAKGDGITDDSKAIQKSMDLAGKNGGTVFFPKGTYMISRLSQSKAGSLYASSNIRLSGERGKSVIKLAPGQLNFTRMLYVENVENIIVEDLIFDGNVNKQPGFPKKVHEHMAGLFINQSANVKVRNSSFINTGGDGIGIRGPKSSSRNIYIDSCYFSGNHRNGITLGSGFRNVVIENNFFGSSIKQSPIDSEPEGGHCENVTIRNNEINTPTIVTLGGPAENNTAKGYIVENNRFNNCAIFSIHAEDVVIRNNSFILPNPQRAAITLQSFNNNISVSNNTFDIANKDAFYIVSTRYTGILPQNITIASNKIRLKGESARLLHIRGANNVTFKDNDVQGDTGLEAVYALSTRPMKDLSLTGNKLNGFKKAVIVRPLNDNAVEGLTITGNTINSPVSGPQIDLNYTGKAGLVRDVKVNANTMGKPHVNSVLLRKDQRIEK